MDLLVLFGSCCCVVIGILTLIKSFWLVFIRPGHVSIRQKPGYKPQIIREGFNFVKYPLERLAHYVWTYNEETENGVVRQTTFSGNEIYINNMTMNPAPVKCKTNTGVIAEVNGVFTFVISDPVKAVTSMPNLLGFLEICIKNATVQAVLNYSHDDIIGSNYQLAKNIRSIFESQVLEYGVECSEYIIEDIKMDPQIMNHRQNQILKASKHELMLEDARRKSESEILAQKNASQLEMEKQRLEMEKIRAENEVVRSRQMCELEMEKRKLEIEEIKANQDIMKQRADQHETEFIDRQREQHIERLRAQGFTPREIVDYLSAEHIVEAAKQTDKWIIGGPEYARMLSGSFGFLDKYSQQD